MKRIFTIITLLAVSAGWTWAQTDPTPQTIPFSHDWGTEHLAAADPLPFISFRSGSETLPIDDATIEALDTDASTTRFIKSSTLDELVEFGEASVTRTDGAGAYSYKNGDDVQVIISPHTRIYTLNFAVDATSATNLELSFDMTYTEALTSGGMKMLTQYRLGNTATGNPWTTIDHASYNTSTFGLSRGDVTPFNSIPLPAETNDEAIVEIRFLFSSLLTPNYGINETVSIGIDNITVEESSAPDFAPVVPANSFGCDAITITASGTTPGGSYKWYDAPTGGSEITDGLSGDGNSTIEVNGTGSVYVAAVNAFGLEGTSRAEAAYEISTQPADAVEVTIDDQTRCGSGMVTLQASGASGTAVYRWYDASTGGSILKTGSDVDDDQFEVADLASTTDYYVVLYDESCAVIKESENRTKITATINTIPSTPDLVDADISECGTTEIEIEVDSPDSGLEYNWYDAATDGNLTGNGATLDLGLVSESVSLYVEAVTDEGCSSSSRTEASVTIKEAPDNTVTQDGSKLVATSGYQSYQWSLDEIENELDGETSNKITIGDGGTYMVEITAANGCTAIGSKFIPKTDGDTLFFENFQNGMPAEFTLVKKDEGVNKVGVYDDVADTWYVERASSSSDFFGGFENFVARSVSYYEAPEGGWPDGLQNVSADRWMILSKITFNNLGDAPFIQWKAASNTSSGNFPDDYELRYSASYDPNSPDDVSGFLAADPIFSIEGELTDPQERKVLLPTELEGASGYFAFRITTSATGVSGDSGGDRLVIDDILVSRGGVKDQVLTVGDEANSVGIVAYPNPTSDRLQLNFTMHQGGTVAMTMHDFSGRLVLQERWKSAPGVNVRNLDMLSLESGMYILSLALPDANHTIKVYKAD